MLATHVNTNGKIVVTREADLCGQVVQSVDGVGNFTYTCEGTSTTLDPSTRVCQADFVAYVPREFSFHCELGTCPP